MSEKCALLRLLLVAVLLPAVPHAEQLLGQKLANMEHIDPGHGTLATKPSVHTASGLGAYDHNVTLHLKYACDGSSRSCRKKPCMLTRSGWCKEYERQQPLPYKPPPRGTHDCPANVTGLPGLEGHVVPCSGIGVCNYDVGICDCPAGWGGADCSVRVPRPCTHRVREAMRDQANIDVVISHMHPDGSDIDPHEEGWTASRCIGTCNDDIAACFCPNNTKHGRINARPESRLPGTPPIKVGRPLAEHCKPAMQGRNGEKLGYGRMNYDGLYGPEGYCNADTHTATMITCGCEHDGYGGLFCEPKYEPFCLNQCSGHGDCQTGFCWCHEGWYGVDCSRKKGGMDMEQGDQHGPRPWLSNMMMAPEGPPAAAPDLESAAKAAATAALGPNNNPTGGARLQHVPRPRPLIYVYDMPSEFTMRILQYRNTPNACTWRRNCQDNTTAPFGSFIYGIETYLHETLLTSKHRTFDPDEADYFYVPVYVACYYWPVLGWADWPWFGPTPSVNNRAIQGAYMYLKAKRWVQKHFPFWDRRGGRDHIFLTPMDEGACYLPNEVYQNAVILTHWGRMDLGHQSNTAWGYDNYTWDGAEWAGLLKARTGLNDWKEIFQGRPCYDPVKDLVIPMLKVPGGYARSPLLGATPMDRDILFLLKGDVGFWRAPCYSRGIRQKLVGLSVSHKWWQQFRMLIGPTDKIGGDYSHLLSRSKFCAVVPGDGWSSRAIDAILHGCIPVVIMDGVHEAFESILEYDAFTIRIKEKAVNEHLPHFLLSISDEQVERMQRRLAMVMSRFAYAQGAIMHKALQEVRNFNGGDAMYAGLVEAERRQQMAAAALARSAAVERSSSGDSNAGNGGLSTPATGLLRSLLHHGHHTEDLSMGGRDEHRDNNGIGRSGRGLRQFVHHHQTQHQQQHKPGSPEQEEVTKHWQSRGYQGHPFAPMRRFPVRQDAFNTIMAWLYSRIPHTRGGGSVGV